MTNTHAETTEAAKQFKPTPEEVKAAEAREQALFQQHAHDYLNGRVVHLSIELERALAELTEVRGHLAMYEAAQGEAAEA